MMKVSGLSGLESIALDPKDKKLTVTGDIDPVAVVAKLRKLCHTEIVSVGPAKEPEKKKEVPKKEEPKKEEPKKDDKKKDGPKQDPAQLLKAYQPYYQQPYYYHQYQPYQQPPVAAAAAAPYYNRSVEEDPNGCVIC
ncbi:UNVERIFIED_CONTAM: Heavy metal-associated isoprenylated plant protein 12 [Sesamum radiatum]|uniref:Heavy metal-associated isoprenylated plant protein 12 n=1 Tax=Sesamum radiatum TaxID=300843 RepID=A0AAW2KEL0_SESRA